VEPAEGATGEGVTVSAPTGVVELTLDGFAHGGSAVGRLPDGTACFVDYAIPGERVRVRVVDRRRRWARAELVEIVTPSPDRVEPPCPLFGPGRCGGCKLQHIAPQRQAELLATVIGDQLRRIGHLDVDDPAEMIRPHGGDGLGYRHRARFAVDPSGHLAFRRTGSHDLIAVGDCPLLAPSARTVLHRIAAGWRGAQEVTLQVGTDGRATLALRANGPVVAPDDTPSGGDQSVSFTVAGRTFRASATSFFQTSVAAAEQLVGLVRRLTAVKAGEHVVELYAGVGLLTAALASEGARVTAIESSAAACRDARANTAGLDVTVLRASVSPRIRLRDPASSSEVVGPSPVDAVVLDPPRRGAGTEVMAWIATLQPARVTYVSCDPATFARDARTLVDHGYMLAEVVGVDQFTHTGHVELVAAFHRPV
jgi:tRNA/tmRNA/rRNA uracil-C5-methylase (TrmA/RlmC/RlmD family)